MNNTVYYKPFDKVAFRIPVWGIEEYLPIAKQLISCEKIEDSKFIKALYMATPVLHGELLKYNENKLKGKDLLMFQISILKYLARMSWRCTPFGLFAACGVGNIKKTNSELEKKELRFKSKTRLDMDYLCALIFDLTNNKLIKDQLRFYPNTSLYAIGERIRYHEFDLKNGIRNYTLSEVESSSYLSKIFKSCEHGGTINELAINIVDEDVTIDESVLFIQELIDNQILVSELEPQVSCPDLLKQTIQKISKLDGLDEIVSNLKSIKELLKEVDDAYERSSLDKYNEIIKHLDLLKTPYDQKTIFQADLNVEAEHLSLNEKIISDVEKGIEFFNKITPKIKDRQLDKFKQDFYNKYENEKIPLNIALDSDSGVGFGNSNPQHNDISPLLKGIYIPEKRRSSKKVELYPFHDLLVKKYEKFISSKLSIIEILDSDLQEYKSDWNDLPDTFSTMIEVLSSEDNIEKPNILIRNAGGATAASLLARFCHINADIHSLVNEIAEKEDKLSEEKILAEVVHLPESRVGNILMRPPIRKYEIPYLASSSLDSRYRVEVSDLLVSVPNGERIILTSKRLKCEIIPRLSTAHNYSTKSLPIYSFLGALQNQNKRGGIGFNWGPLLIGRNYLPRVIYKNLIISPATWNIDSKKSKSVPKITDPDFQSKVSEFKRDLNLPNNIFLIQGDNKLLINLNERSSAQMLFSIVKKNSFQVEEVLFDIDNSFVNQKDKNYTNQVIINFYKCNNQDL
ncbi:hypothetical protein DWB61_09725 [Ancylomarina euxinus]|uniref:Lantibiotic dehydratase N-terminal domain-containing protein n=1 Tax=Ancylomarina euxinus TaxID=2283627 RepID=A0A425Y1H1_9BACT|nr:lantibiotic dehydratase family protein [Ancylomarina euxinus]MCZ4693793.1 lantibiotic dehydratase family protein [Ancylomarina euxinus]MUP15127.1 hypothetical protein [Ancylomarina euxinus]RRG21550.1 hypothetical protein DWB61_09725 [Ancylomarina euxinus]